MLAKISFITSITPSSLFKFDFLVVEHNNNPVPRSFNPGAGLLFLWVCPIKKMILPGRNSWVCPSQWNNEPHFLLPCCWGIVSTVAVPQQGWISAVLKCFSELCVKSLMWNGRVKSDKSLFLSSSISTLIYFVARAPKRICLLFYLHLTGLELHFNSGVLKKKKIQEKLGLP